MRQITIDPTLGKYLSGLSGQVLLCDSDGIVVGFFQPVPGRLRLEDSLQLEPPPMSPE